MLHILAGSAPANVSEPHVEGWRRAYTSIPTPSFPTRSTTPIFAPQRLVKMVLRYRDLQSVLPFNGWWQNPITATFTVRGCAHRCVTCGNSRDACAHSEPASAPDLPQPRQPGQEHGGHQPHLAGPIFLVGDLRQAGDATPARCSSLLRTAGSSNEIVFELFAVPPADLPAGRSTAAVHALEPRAFAREPRPGSAAMPRKATVSFTNEEMEAIIQQALRAALPRASTSSS